jgi:cytochrome c-type biogenesis protein CcmF
VRQVVLASRRQGWRGLVGRTNGGMIVHLGVVMIAVALAASGSYDTERELTLAEGESATVAGHEITYVGMRRTEESNRTSIQADVAIDGDVYAPAINVFPQGEQRIGTPSVKTSLTRDVYLALLRVPDGLGADSTSADTPADGQVVIRVIVQPMVVWLWIGGGVMALGTALAAFPGRRRNPVDPVSAPVGETRGEESPVPDDEDGERPSEPETVEAGV